MVHIHLQKAVILTKKRRILITGAAGLFGSILRHHWKNRYPLHLADIRPIETLAAHEKFTKTDITQYEQMLHACQDIDTVIHLAAYPGDGAAFYNTLLKLNIIGAYNAFQAAHQAGCRRLIFASSVDAVQGYWDTGNIRWDVPVFPQNLYGATKCWGEALGRVYSAQHGLSCICVRLCNPHFDPHANQHPEDIISGLSRRDAAQLFTRCIEVENLPFALVHGISKHRHGRLDSSGHQLIGFVPQDGTAL